MTTHRNRRSNERGAAATALLVTALVTGLGIFVYIAIPYGEASDAKAGSRTAADAAALAGAEGARDDLIDAISLGDVPGAWTSLGDTAGLGYADAEAYASRNGATLVDYFYDITDGTAHATVESSPVDGTRPRSDAVAQFDVPDCGDLDALPIPTPTPLPPTETPTPTPSASPSASTSPTASPTPSYPEIDVDVDCGPFDLGLHVKFDENGQPTILLPPGQIVDPDTMDIRLID